jgi:sortase A
VTCRIILRTPRESPLGRLSVMRILQRVFLIAGLLAVGYAAYTYAARYAYQTVESWKFDRALSRTYEQPASIGAKPSPMAQPVVRISVPRLHIAAMVKEGVDDRTLDVAVGHIPATQLPGRPGNVGLAAHRDTLFRNLKDVETDDSIILSTREREYVYRVIWQKVVNPSDVGVLAATAGEETLTLVTCYPFYFVGNAPKRFVVRARRVDSD